MLHGNPTTTVPGSSQYYVLSLETEALALQEGPLQEPRQLVPVFVLRQHQQAEARVRGR